MYKPVPLKKMAGVLDTRSLPEELDESRWSKRLNFDVSTGGSLCRLPGFRRFLADSFQCNEDLHDQLLPLQMYYNDLDTKPAGADDVSVYPSAKCGTELQTRTQGREALTFGKEVLTTEGERYLITGSQSRLYVLNEGTGNYQILADGMGGTPTDDLSVRWSAGRVLNDVILSNNVDRPMSWHIGDEPNGCAMRALKAIPDLALINLTKAAIVFEFKGVVFLMDVVMDNARYKGRILWSDFNDGLSYDPAKADSITGFVDLPGQEILAVDFLGDTIFVFTNKGIWKGGATGNPDGAFAFGQAYGHKDGASCIAFRNTLVSTGAELYYVGDDGVYRYDDFTLQPERTEWVHDGSGEMFRELNTTACASHVAAYKKNLKQVWISYALQGSSIPTRTFMFSPEFKFASYIDAGFTCLFSYQPDPRLSFRDFLRKYCACTVEQLGAEFVKEGMPCANPDCATPPEVIFTTETMEIDGLITENWDAAEASPNSLCALLGSIKADELCAECQTDKLFCGVSSIDNCIKQIGDSYSREICVNAEAGQGTLEGFNYESFAPTFFYNGYYSVQTSAPLRFFDNQKANIEKVLVNVAAGDQAEPCAVAVRVGHSFSPLDPSDAGCSVVWSNRLNRYFQCAQRLSAAEYVQRRLTPNVGINFPIFTTGYYLYVELTIATLSVQADLKSALVPGVGGQGCISSATLNVRRA